MRIYLNINCNEGDEEWRAQIPVRNKNKTLNMLCMKNGIIHQCFIAPPNTIF